MYCGIYKITNNINNKCYIGQAKDITERWKVHRRPSTWKDNSNKILYKAFKKYGIENFTFEIIKECNVDELDRLEIYYIAEFDSYKNGYNGTLGGKGYKVDEETYFKNKLTKMYSESLSDIILKFTPMYVTTKDSFEDFKFIHSKRQLKVIIKERKSYGERFDMGVDYINYDENNNSHKYILLADVNRYLLDNIRELEYDYRISKIFSDSEYRKLIDVLEGNLHENKINLDYLVNYDDVDEFVIENNSTEIKDSIYDLIPDYDELGGDEYFDACYF